MVAISQQAVAAGITAPGNGDLDSTTTAISDIGALIIETFATAGFVARDPRRDASARPRSRRSRSR